MENFLEGRELNSIHVKGGLIAGQKKTYELWETGQIVKITDELLVADIDRWLKEAKKLNVNSLDYLSYMILENW